MLHRLRTARRPVELEYRARETKSRGERGKGQASVRTIETEDRAVLVGAERKKLL